jgi:hypothetical protein
MANDLPSLGHHTRFDGDSSERFFKSTNLPHLKIEITDSELLEINKDNRKYVRATVREGDVVYQDVGLHLKGSAGSFRELGDRPSLTLNFDKFIDGQAFHGLEKMHLNNSVQDPSYLTDILCAEMFLAAGVPATRGTHARVELNGRDLGLYVLKEGFDKAFLRRHFKKTSGNLYESGFMNDITEQLHKNSGNGDVLDYADLTSVVAAAKESDPIKRIAELERVLDLDRFMSFVALEVMMSHWDGYAIRRNNYRIYHDPTPGKIVFLPHGMDQMFSHPEFPILPQFHGLVGQAVVTAPDGRQRYLQRMAVLLTNVFKVHTLTNRVRELQRRVRPVLASIHPDLAITHDVAVDSLRQRIIQRARNLEQQIRVPESVPLSFDEDGVARISDWRPQVDTGIAILDHTVVDGNKPSLHIHVKSQAPCVASWRARLVLQPGQYRFEGQLRTAALLPIRDEKGEGAGLRISGSPQARTNQVSGDALWTRSAHEFHVELGREAIELVCEIRAAKGEVWFDNDSLRLVRQDDRNLREK